MSAFSLQQAQKRVDSKTTLFWLRRDLRLDDNVGLFHALKEIHHVLPIFIFDESILDRLEDLADARVSFIHESLQYLQQDLIKIGSSLLVLKGNPKTIFSALNPAAVYTNHDYEPYARKRDAEIAEVMRLKNISFQTFKDQVIFEKSEVTKDDGLPYKWDTLDYPPAIETTN